MTKIILSGCNGRMGQAVAALCEEDPQVTLTAGIDPLGGARQGFPVFTLPGECTAEGDVLVDFSSPAALTPLLEFALTRQMPVVLATTGYAPDQLEEIGQAARVIPIFRSANLSLGVNLLRELTRRVAQVLGDDFDVEIVERHHAKKLDAPSGTALMLADAAREGLPFQPQYVYERQSVRKPRDHREIGISALRGGTIVGDHEVVFAGPDEVVELHHHAASRAVFARGALRAAKYLPTCKAPRLYSMDDLLKDMV